VTATRSGSTFAKRARQSPRSRCADLQLVLQHGSHNKGVARPWLVKGSRPASPDHPRRNPSIMATQSSCARHNFATHGRTCPHDDAFIAQQPVDLLDRVLTQKARAWPGLADHRHAATSPSSRRPRRLPVTSRAWLNIFRDIHRDILNKLTCLIGWFMATLCWMEFSIPYLSTKFGHMSPAKMRGFRDGIYNIRTIEMSCQKAYYRIA